MTQEQFDAEWDAKIEAAAQAVVDGTGTEDEVEALMIAYGEAFAEKFGPCEF